MFHGPMAYEASTQSLGDKAWPLMLMLSFLWPIAIPIAYMLCQKIIGEAPFFSVGFFIPFCVFVLLGTTIISTLVVQINLSPQKLDKEGILKQALTFGNLSLVKKHWSKTERTPSTFDPLFVALDNKQSKVANYLLMQGVSAKRYEQLVDGYSRGETPLHTATKNGMIETIQKLFLLGADPDTKSNDGQTPLHYISVTDDKMLSVLEIFKTNGANFAAIDHNGNTPLIKLAMINAPMLKNRPPLAKRLISYGCPKDFKNNNGDSALSILKREQPYELELIQVLTGNVE
jgi:hypothetical protein